MSKHVRKILPLLLCLLLMACLLPAAYADEAEVSTLAELQNALNSHARSITFANDLIVPETDITVPSGVTLTVQDVTFWANNIEVQQGGSIIADSGNMSAMNRLTVNGSLIINDAVVIADGSSWANLKNASITYGNEDSKISLHFPTFNSQEARAAIATAAEITSQRVNPLVFINYDAEIRDNYVIPEGVTVEHSGLIITDGATLTVNGKFRTMMEGILTVNGNLINNGILNVWDNGTVNIPGSLSNNGRVTVEETGTLNVQGNLTSSDDILVRDFGTVNVVPGGSMTNNGKIDLSTSGVLRIGGVFTANPGSRIDVPDVDPANIQPRVIREGDGEFNNMSSIVFSKSILDRGVDCSALIQNINMNDYCRHVDRKRPEIHYYPGSMLNFEGMFPVGGKYIERLEVHGLDTLTLSSSVEIPVFDDGTAATVDMSEATLVVPSGRTITVNGELAVNELVIENGGSVTVNGKLSVKDLVVEDGGNVVTGDGGSIKYVAEDTEPKVGSFSQLQTIIGAFNQLREQDPTARIDTYTSGNFAITENITIPDGFQLRCGNDLTIAAEATVTVNGKLDAIDNGYINILGKVVNYGQVGMFGSGVIHVGGTLENRSQICYENVTSDVKHLVVDKKENLQIWGPFCVYDGVSLTENVLGFPVDNWCRSIKKDEPNVSAFIPLFGIQLEDKSSSGSYSYIEVRGTEAFTLTKDMTVPAGTEVVMNSIVLTVPNGKSLTVNGELAVMELVIESGGNVTVNESGYLDIGGGGFNILDGGTLTLNNTRIDAPYPRSNPDTIENIVYNGGEAGVILHLNIGNPDGVADVFAAASEASSARVNCIVELRTDWTMTGTINAPDVAFEIPEEYTVTVNGDLTIGEIRSWGTINLNGRLSPSDMCLNGTIAVGEGATLNEAVLHDLVNGRPRGSVTVADASARVFFRGDGLDEALLPDWITLQGSGTTACICYRAESEEDFTGMTSEISSLPEGFVGSLRVQYPAVIQGNVDFPGVELRIEGKKGGSLTIAEGAVLRASNVNIKSANVTISGTFIAGPSYRHSGSVTMNSDDGNNSTLTVTKTGILGGYQCTVEVPRGVETASCVFGFNPGQMKDVSHPFRPNFQIYLIVAEMSLPAGLTTIESEAFAGGSFNSVYIPESVTSIASDAFSDRTGLKVYGEYGTAAETFAHDHGFPFAPPNLATQPA